MTSKRSAIAHAGDGLVSSAGMVWRTADVEEDCWRRQGGFRRRWGETFRSLGVNWHECSASIGMSISACYCGSDRPFSDCCDRFLSGKELPETAEELMRSRYSAFCTGNVDYLIETHHPSKWGSDRAVLAESCKRTEWMGLNVLSTSGGKATDKEGYVEFVALYRDRVVGQLRERSRFVREGDRWFYTDGVHSPSSPPNRNEPCWCGSGKKYKRCHGKS